MPDLEAREAKLVQYLNEAFGKEKELETALQAHIAMTTRAPYKKRLREHLTETKQHARQLEQRIKALGGKAEQVSIDAPEPVALGAKVALEVGSRALAAAQGPLHAIRGTGEQEKMLKNAKTEYREEHEEIATYTAIEALASAVGDSDTAKLARAIRREEESMARFLERQIPALTKAVAQAEIPASQRRSASGGRRSASGAKGASRKATATKTRGKATASKARGKGAAAKATGKRTAGKAASRAAAGARKAASSSSKAASKAASGSGKAATAQRKAAGKATTRKISRAGTGTRSRAKAGASR